MNIPIYVNSLARAVDRRESITARLKAAGVEFEISDAIDGKTALGDYADQVRHEIAYINYGRKLRPGRCGPPTASMLSTVLNLSASATNCLSINSALTWAGILFYTILVWRILTGRKIYMAKALAPACSPTNGMLITAKFRNVVSSARVHFLANT